VATITKQPNNITTKQAKFYKIARLIEFVRLGYGKKLNNRANYIARELIAFQRDWMKILMGLTQARFQNKIVNIRTLRKTVFTKSFHTTVFREILDEVLEFGEAYPDLALIIESEKIAKNSRHYKLTLLGSELLRNLIYEKWDRFYFKEARKSGGIKHVWLVEQVKRKLEKDGWKIYAEEKALSMSTDQFVYFDLMCMKEGEDGLEFRVFECETGIDAQYREERYVEQIKKNILKSLKLGKYSGFRANIICLNSEILDKITQVADTFFKEHGYGHVQICTLNNFQSDKDWIYNKKIDYKLKTNASLIKKSVLKLLDGHLNRQKTQTTRARHVKKIRAEIDAILDIYQHDITRSLDQLYALLDKLLIHDDLFLEQIQEVKYWIQLFTYHDRVLMTGLYYEFGKKKRFYLTTSAIYHHIPTLMPRLEGSMFSDHLNQIPNPETIFTKKIKLETLDFSGLLIIKPNLFSYKPKSINDFQVSLFCFINQNAASETIETLKNTIMDIKKEIFFCEHEIQDAVIDINDKMKRCLKHSKRSLSEYYWADKRAHK